MKKNKNLNVFIIIMCMCFLTACDFGNYFSKTIEIAPAETQNNIKTDDVLEEQEEIVIKPVILDDQVTSIVFGGDNLIHASVYNNAKTDDGYDFTHIYENIAYYFTDADIAMINQETVINDLYAPATYPRFSTPIEMADALANMGIDIITVANNHVYDINADGLAWSLDYFENNTDILTIGAYQNQEDYENIRLITENDTIFSFIGATESTNGLSISSSSEIVLLQTANEQELLDRIAKAREISDVVIVNVHWGNEYTNTPNNTQKNLALKIAEAGADIIIGHHPHVIQPIEYIETESGHTTLVAYSLGNLMSTQDKIPRIIGGLVDIEITKSYIDEENFEITISNCEFLPIITHYVSGFKQLTAYPLHMYTDEIAKTHGLYTSSFGIDYINNYIANVIDEKFITLS